MAHTLMEYINQMMSACADIPHSIFMTIRRTGWTIKWHIIDPVILAYAFRYNKIKLVKFVCPEEASIVEKYGLPLDEILHVAIAIENHESVEKLLLGGVSLNHKNIDNKTPIQLAATVGFHTLRRSLVERVLREIKKRHFHYAIKRKILRKLHIACLEHNVVEVHHLLRRNSRTVNLKICRSSPIWPGYTPLHLAVELGNSVMTFQHLLKFGADPNIVNVDGWTPIHLAHRLRNYNALYCIFLKSKIRLMNPCDDKGYTHFHIACASIGQTKPDILWCFLTDSSVNVNATVKEWPGYAPLHLLLSDSYSVYMHPEHNFEAVKLLLVHGADVNLKILDGTTPLHLAIKYYRAKVHSRSNANFRVASLFTARKIVRLLLSYGADPNATDNNGLTPILLALKWNYSFIIRDIFHCMPKAVLEVNPRDDLGCTYFHLACAFGPLHVVEAFLRYRGSVDVNVVISKSHLRWPGFTALHLVAFYNHGVDVAELLLRNGAHVNAQTTSGWTALHLASKSGNYRIVKTLISRGAIVNIRDFENLDTPLHHACLNLRAEVAQELVKAGANLDDRNRIGRAPIHSFLKYDGWRGFRREPAMNDTMEVLLEAGCDIDCEDAQGFTPLNLACMNDDFIWISVLVKFGADIVPILKSLNFGYSYHWDTTLKLSILRQRVMSLRGIPLEQDHLMQPVISKFQQRKYHFIREECLMELDFLKTIPLNANTAVCDILYMNPSELVRYVHNLNFKRIFCNVEYQTKFENYWDYLIAQYRRGNTLVSLVKRAKKSLTLIARKELPELCSEAILRYLRHKDLENLAKACKVPYQSMTQL